jgi:hypothetical protein
LLNLPNPITLTPDANGLVTAAMFTAFGTTRCPNGTLRMGRGKSTCRAGR